MLAVLNRFHTFISRMSRGVGFVRSVALVAGGTALSQGVVLLISPILSRLYTPEDFGILGVYTSLFSLLTAVTSLCYEQAIPLPKKDRSAANLLVLSLILVLVMSFFTGFLFLLGGERVALWANTPTLGRYLWLLPLSMLGAAGYQSLNYWMARKQRFAAISYAKLVHSLGLVGMQATLGVWRLGPIGLIVGHVVGQLSGVIPLLKDFRLSKGEIVPQKWPALARTYKNFPLFAVWTSLINAIGMKALPLLFAKYFTLDTAGFFSQTMRVLGLPATLIGQSVAQVFYPKAARNEEESGSAKRLVEQVATSLFILSFLSFSFVALHGADLFAWILGDSWRVSGVYAQYLAPCFMISFVSSPLSSFALVKGKQKDTFIYGLLLTGSRLGAIGLGNWYDSPNLAVISFSAVNVLFYLLYIGWILRLAGSSLLACLSRIKVFVLGGVLLFIGLFSLKPLLAPLASLIISVGSLGLFGLWFGLKDRRGTVGE